MHRDSRVSINTNVFNFFQFLNCPGVARLSWPLHLLEMKPWSTLSCTLKWWMRFTTSGDSIQHFRRIFPSLFIHRRQQGKTNVPYSNWWTTFLWPPKFLCTVGIRITDNWLPEASNYPWLIWTFDKRSYIWVTYNNWTKFSQLLYSSTILVWYYSDTQIKHCSVNRLVFTIKIKNLSCN